MDGWISIYVTNISLNVSIDLRCEVLSMYYSIVITSDDGCISQQREKSKKKGEGQGETRE